MDCTELSQCCRVPVPSEDPDKMDSQEMLRIVLFGTTKTGKSTLGRIIENNSDLFTSKDPLNKGTEITGSQKVHVFDTPGLFKMDDNQEEVVEEIKQSIECAKPGPHVFLFVERFKEFSKVKLDALKVFQNTFGKQAMDYTMVVFTIKKKNLNDAAMEEEIERLSLTRLTNQFHQRYFVFNIADKESEKSQVSELLGKITKIKKEQDGIYTPKMLKEAEKALKQQKKEKLKPGEWHSFYDRCGLIAMAVGCAVGYFVCGGELTPTVGAGVGAVVGLILCIGIAFLGVLAKIRVQACYK